MKRSGLIVLCGVLFLLSYAGMLAAQNPSVDMYINSWKNSLPKNSHGTMIERDILTQGDPLNPTKPGGVLKFAKKFARAVLESGVRTESASHPGQEEVFYVVRGSGRIESNGRSAELIEGTAVLIPPDVKHVLINDSEDILELLVLVGDYMADTAPPKEIVVKNYHSLPVHAGGHWTHIVRELFKAEDGLGGFFAVLLVSIDGMNIAEPHPHGLDDEECWHAVKGESIVWLGHEIRWQEEGTAFSIPQTGKVTHANINISNEPVMFFYFRTFPKLSERMRNQR